jgi:DICT domain-containing protein/predicted DNA-binding transcriptional regulator AlpA
MLDIMSSLSIGDLVARTGVSEATLRAWERRHGFPSPERTASGRRRYSEEQVEQVKRLLAGRKSGLPLPLAIERAREGATPDSFSAFATLRRRAPQAESRIVQKPMLLALSHAIEDESLARAERQLLFASFQRERFYREEQSRWRQLTDNAIASAVFADFAEPSMPPIGPIEVPLTHTPSLAREWVVVCYGERSAICLAARERASSDPADASAARSFELVWTVDPAVVRELAHACVRAASAVAPELTARAASTLAGEPAASPEDQLQFGMAVINRTLSLLGDPFGHQLRWRS